MPHQCPNCNCITRMSPGLCPVCGTSTIATSGGRRLKPVFVSGPVNPPAVGIQTLPHDVRALIFSMTTPADRRSLRLVCTQFDDTVQRAFRNSQVRSEEDIFAATQLLNGAFCLIAELSDLWSSRYDAAMQDADRVHQARGVLTGLVMGNPSAAVSDDLSSAGFFDEFQRGLDSATEILDRIDRLLERLISWNAQTHGAGWTNRRIHAGPGRPSVRTIDAIGSVRERVRALRSTVTNLRVDFDRGRQLA